MKAKYPQSCLVGSKEPQQEAVSGVESRALGISMSRPAWASPRAAAVDRPLLLLYCTLNNTGGSKFAQRKESSLINSTQKKGK